MTFTDFTSGKTIDQIHDFRESGDLDKLEVNEEVLSTGKYFFPYTLFNLVLTFNRV